MVKTGGKEDLGWVQREEFVRIQVSINHWRLQERGEALEQKGGENRGEFGCIGHVLNSKLT